MKTLLILLIATVLGPVSFAGNFFGPGPFNNGGYWPGYLNGKYMAVVTGKNITGTLGFAIIDGTPPFRINEEQTSAGGAVQSTALVNQQITPDQLQNYFAIFVEGITYSGTTVAGIDLSTSTVAGSLQSQGGLPTDLTFDATDALSVVSRGLSGGFQATINDDKALFTFSGNGELSTPANKQKAILSAVPTEANPFDPLVPAGTITNEVISGRIETKTTPFKLSGVRTSFNANNPAAIQDAQDFQGGGSGGN